MRKYLRTLAVAGVVGLLGVAGCGSPPPEENGSGDNANDPTAEDFKACMVSDSGGFDDKSFNQTSHKGLTDAEDELGISTAQLESKSDNDYPSNINTMVDQNCNMIVTVGFKLGDATYEAAKANPDVYFAIVDYEYTDTEKQPPLDNLQSLLFNTAESSFLAGYLAAGVSESGKVGTFGGVKIPTVTIFMDGFWEGVQHYNKEKDADVQVLGWSEEKQSGLFTNDFEDTVKGQNSGQNLISQGADIIFPVAGPAGLGGLQAAKTSGKADGIWVDTDGCVSAAEYCPNLVSSVYKAMDLAVQTSITNAYNDEFDNTPYVGTLDNEGTGLSPYHEFDDKVPGELQSEIDQLRTDIIDGNIDVQSEVQPQAK